MAKNAVRNIFDAQKKAAEHAKKVFTEVDFKFRGDTDEEIKAQMNKVFSAILNAWAEGWLAK